MWVHSKSQRILPVGKQSIASRVPKAPWGPVCGNESGHTRGEESWACWGPTPFIEYSWKAEVWDPIWGLWKHRKCRKKKTGKASPRGLPWLVCVLHWGKVAEVSHYHHCQAMVCFAVYVLAFLARLNGEGRTYYSLLFYCTPQIQLSRITVYVFSGSGNRCALRSMKSWASPFMQLCLSIWCSV